MKKAIKLLTSFAVIFGSLTLGLCISIQGPTLMDLIDLLHVNQDMMSYSLAYAGLAYSFGGFLSGFIFNYLNRQLLMGTFYMIFGIANLITPWIPSYLLFSVITFSKMMVAGGTDCGSNVWILEMWPGQDAWLQALHFAFAVGTALGPVVAEPFLSPELPDEHELERLHGPNYSQQDNFTMPEPGETRIYVPYSVCAFASMAASIALFSLYIYEPYEAPTKDSNTVASTQQKTKGQQQLENYKIAQETGKKTSIERLALQEKDGLECWEVTILDSNNKSDLVDCQQNHQQQQQNHHHHHHQLQLQQKPQTEPQPLPQEPETPSQQPDTQSQPEGKPQFRLVDDLPVSPVAAQADSSQLELVLVVPRDVATPPPPPTDSGNNNTGKQEPSQNNQHQHLQRHNKYHQNLNQHQQNQLQPPLGHKHKHDDDGDDDDDDDEITLAVQISEPAPPLDVGSHLLTPRHLTGSMQKPDLESQQTAKVKVTSRAPDTDGPPPFYVIAAIFMAACCLLFYCGIEITSMNYLATFAVNTDLQLSKSTAAYLSSALTTSFAVGRGFGIWIAISVKPHFLFYGCVAAVAIGNVAMLFFANTNELLLWISLCFFGIGCGPMYPAIVSFYDEKISKVTNTVSGIFILASMFQVALSSLIVGHHIIDNALILIELNIISSVLLLILFGSLHLLTKIKRSQRARKLKAKQLQLAIQNAIS